MADPTAAEFEYLVRLKLVLASASPRRALLLATAGYPHDIRIPAVDETPIEGETAAETALRLSELKASAVRRDADEVAIAADTIVVLDGGQLGKPADPAEARRMLTSLSGRTHSVLTGWTVVSDEAERFGVAESRVTFNELSQDDIHRYVTDTDPHDFAGAYGIHVDRGRLIADVQGSRANVMGLPLREVVEAIEDLGVERSAPNR